MDADRERGKGFSPGHPIGEARRVKDGIRDALENGISFSAVLSEAEMNAFLTDARIPVLLGQKQGKGLLTYGRRTSEAGEIVFAVKVVDPMGLLRDVVEKHGREKEEILDGMRRWGQLRTAIHAYHVGFERPELEEVDVNELVCEALELWESFCPSLRNELKKAGIGDDTLLMAESWEA